MQAILILFLLVFSSFFLPACEDNAQDTPEKTTITPAERTRQSHESKASTSPKIGKATPPKVTPQRYRTTASSGLIIRKAPDIKADRIGKLPYGSIVELVAETKVKHRILDDGRTIEGVWVKIKFTNFPYEISSLEAYQAGGEGYVFNQFITKLHQASVEIEAIDKASFQALYRDPAPAELTKITDQKEMERLLGPRVTWKDSELIEGRLLDQITLDNGQRLRFLLDDLEIMAYYPSEGVFLFEGGHSTEFSISIKTGESLETLGNPDYYVTSPDQQFRLNGWYPGQECSSYFFQEKSGDQYHYLVDFGWGSEQYGTELCYFNKFCWLENGNFVYAANEYVDGLATERYYKGQIKRLR